MEQTASPQWDSNPSLMSDSYAHNPGQVLAYVGCAAYHLHSIINNKTFPVARNFIMLSTILCEHIEIDFKI